MATKVLFCLGNTSNKWLLSSHKPKAFPPNLLRHVRSFRKLRDAPKQNVAPFSRLNMETGPIQPGRLWKCLGFSILFSGASLIGTVIWEYENIRERAYSKRTGWRAMVHNWWHSLDDGKKLFYPICLINVLVFCAWRIPALQGTMLKYFCSNPASSAMCWPMVLSTFSHYSLFHLGANMFVLNSFSSPVASALGKEQFLALYLTSGVMSNFASYLYKTMFALPGYSLGASGAIMGILAFACTQYPETRLSIIFLPMCTFTAGVAIKAMVGIDTLGCILGWRFFDHAAHLGGAAWGIFWQQWGNSHIWRNRAPILTRWHSIREPPPKR
ncbi:presenilins-associated rhomboid-like protein, mitochondrial isoform X2 [Athalia rosae]|uniref:presenilins-associated rhomboid-like protein, mitochondrial isoform X2 n=1 Tax=Athalia rosae TaxID=37344 RepID=UPI000A0ED207|nr:presenilins-associated rhomboid-like protein, mitochondrial isoform X2 [Athalia rosae]